VSRRAAWWRSLALTMAFAMLVALGVADRGYAFPVIMLATAGVGMGALYILFPRGLHFAFGTSAGLALYACLFVVMARAGFPGAEIWAVLPAFLLPVAGFLGTVWAMRRRLAAMAEAGTSFDVGHLGRMARWLIPVWCVGVLSLSLPVNRMPPLQQGLALLAAMGLIAAMVASSVRGVVLLLTDMALVLEELGHRATRIAVPVFAFLIMYGVLVVVFASLYRIADGLSQVPLFATPRGPAALDFPEALYFSLITQATVGYGDLTPQDDGVRLIAGAQVLLGQVLLLFGFAEIMRSRRVQDHRPPGETRPGAAGE